MTADMRVERVEEPAVLVYTWRLPDLPGDDPRRTYVEFTLEPDGDGTVLRRRDRLRQLAIDTRHELRLLQRGDEPKCERFVVFLKHRELHDGGADTGEAHDDFQYTTEDGACVRAPPVTWCASFTGL